MRTPAGKECPYFYGDYHRGKDHEECRLLEPAGLSWRPELCFRCPIPEIRQANACEHMQFTPRLEKPLFFLKPRVQVSTYCTKCECTVAEPRIGCGQCHTLPEIFVLPDDDPDAAA
jgi:hypothetical protein